MKILKNLISTVQEDILASDNRYIAWAWVIGIGAIVLMNVFLTSESVSFMGVADSRESQVNFEYAVEIKKIHVLPGQAVEKGDLLVELNQSELNTQIRELEAEIAPLKAELTVRKRLNLMISNHEAEQTADPLASEIQEKTNELKFLENQKNNLYIFAEISGVVGAVNFKKGEKVPAFSPIMTVSPKNPSYVQGFVHENLHTRLYLDQKVEINTMSDTETTQGRIVSIGSRIVEMPLRMLRNPNVPIWGREVVVEIPKDSHLLLGEKVQIQPQMNFFRLTSAVAADKEMKQTNTPIQGPFPIRIPMSLASRSSFEPSGLIYLPDFKKFLVVSDDTDSDKTPYVFLMDGEGQLDEQPLRIPELEKITDIESISSDGNDIYLMASQSLNSDGKNKSFRNLFVRMNRNGLNFSNLVSTELKPLLLEALKKSSNTALKTLIREEEDQLDIESHAIDKNKLYIGLKKPMMNNKSIVLVIDDFKSIFKNSLSPSQVSIWSLIDFNSAKTNHLSDLLLLDGQFYATTTYSKKSGGALWKIKFESPENSSAELLSTFDDLRPEGIAFDPTDSALVITFDQGKDASSYMKYILSSTIKGPIRHGQ